MHPGIEQGIFRGLIVQGIVLKKFFEGDGKKSLLMEVNESVTKQMYI